MRGSLPKAFLDEKFMAGLELTLGMPRSISSSMQAWLVPSPCPVSTAMHCCDRALGLGAGLSPAHPGTSPWRDAVVPGVKHSNKDG